MEPIGFVFPVKGRTRPEHHPRQIVRGRRREKRRLPAQIARRRLPAAGRPQILKAGVDVQKDRFKVVVWALGASKPVGCAESAKRIYHDRWASFVSPSYGPADFNRQPPFPADPGSLWLALGNRAFVPVPERPRLSSGRDTTDPLFSDQKGDGAVGPGLLLGA
jgi:hypothetical protein